MNIQEELKKIKEKYPELLQIEISYQGSGDSFDSFYEINCSPEDYNIKEEELSDLLWHIIDNSDADFNNDGSSGTIIIDLENMKCSINNYWYYTECYPSGIKEFE